MVPVMALAPTQKDHNLYVSTVSRLEDDDLPAKNLTVSFKLPGEGKIRHFDGFISRFSNPGSKGRLFG